MAIKMTDMQRLALDVYKGKPVMFNEVSGEEALRNAIKEAVGGEFNYKNFRANKYKVFALIEETLDITLGTIIVDQFNSLAEVKHMAVGDTPVFTIQDPSLFRIARIAGGNNDIRRQRLQSKRLVVDVDYFGAKIYAELEQFQAGMVDFAGMVNRLALSFAHDLGARIYEGIANSYTSLNATFGLTGSFDEDKLFEMIQHVEARSGRKAVIYGTRMALRKISRDLNMGFMSDDMKTEINRVGHIGTIAGTDLMLLPQAHKPMTEEFHVDDNMLIILPAGEKIVRLIVEGEATVIETADAGDRTDQQMEYMIQKKMGIGVLETSIYGMYKMTN